MIRSAISKIEGMIFATVFWWGVLMTALCVDMHKEKIKKEEEEKNILKFTKPARRSWTSLKDCSNKDTAKSDPMPVGDLFDTLFGPLKKEDDNESNNEC